jgi:hypothetical protein
MNAAIGAVGIGEIAFLEGQKAQIVTRPGADLVQFADQEIGKRLLRLGCRLLRVLMTALRRLMRRRLVRALMRWLMDGLERGLRCGLWRLRGVA